jgi:putative endonuclease
VPEAYVYILRCDDGSLYTGWTVDVDKRLQTHNSGKGGRYTRSRLPVTLFASRELDDKSAAMREEARVKALTRPEKLALAKSWPLPAEPV